MAICGTMGSSDVTVTSLNVPPTGSELESQKDPIWVSVSHTMTKHVKLISEKDGNHRAQSHSAMTDIVGNLMDTAKEELCKDARSLGCNAVLGMTLNIANHSTGGRSSSKSVFLTMMGTPCVLLRPRSSPILHPAISAFAGGGVEDAPFGKRYSLTGGPPPLRVAAMSGEGEIIST